MRVWGICASISVTSADIWTKFGTEHKYHAANTPEWQNSHKLKIQDGGGRHLEFQKNINNSGLDKDILHQIIWKDAPRPCGDDQRTKSRNWKLIRVTSSNQGLKHMCVDLSDYNRYLNPIRYRTHIPHYRHAAILNFGKNVNNSGLDKDILHQKCIMTMRKWPCDRKSKPEVNSRDDLLMVDFKWKSEASVHRSQWLTNADIWTKFGTGHKYHTVNTPEWPNSHKLKIKMADLRWYHLEWLTEVQRILEF